MTCSSGKMVYLHRNRAKLVAKRLKRRGRGNMDHPPSATLHPYRCGECGLWHLTSSVNRPSGKAHYY